ncbi:MAG: type II toxin-antitoxin system PemK/MazF family toxin [Firmicutes bacterium]|nr:type II toxin-antitoxin system PemK/MazF family toxin [Bacillota bacterium]
MTLKRGEIYFADLGTENVGSEQSGTRPVLIIQNNIGNHYSPTVIVACITSKIYKNNIPTHVRLDKEVYSLNEDSLILCEQIKTIDKTRLGTKIATLTAFDEIRVNRALKLSLSL